VILEFPYEQYWERNAENIIRKLRDLEIEELLEK
jgi:hypothetical protein